MGISIAVETPLQDDVLRLVTALNAHLNPLSPPEFQFQMTVEEMAESATSLFVARDETGRAVGMGALKFHSPHLAEVKRMFTVPEARGRGVGSAIVQRIIAEARAKGIAQLKLETGTKQVMPEAWALYQRNGFSPSSAFLDYPSSAHSAFFAIELG